MKNTPTVDFSRFTGIRTAENDEVARQQNPQQQLRPQAEIEARPTYFQKSQEREGRSEWSGGTFGGGSQSGRSR
jgi:hypothetical protein